MTELDTEHVRMLNAGRQRVAYTSPITSSCLSTVAPKKTQLLQHGNMYGLTFVAFKQGFAMTRNDELEASCADYIKRRQEALDHRQKLTLEEIHELPVSKDVQLSSIVYWIALSVDELTLAVAYGDSVALYEVVHIVEAIRPKPYHTFFKLQAQEIAWCCDPTIQQLTVLTMEKKVIICTLEGRQEEVLTEKDASSVAWSPSGQHIAIGLVDGTIAIYARDSLKLSRTINVPETCADFKVEVHHLNWAEDELFLAGYHHFDATNDKTMALACIFDHNECVELDEVVGFFEVKGRQHQYFSVFLSAWRMFFIGCSLSADIELLVSDPDSSDWQQWKPLERYQARLPDNSADEESFPMGLALNLNSTVSVLVDGDAYPPVPMISCTNTEGLLLHFAFVDTTVHKVDFVMSPLPFDQKSARTLATSTRLSFEAKTNELKALKQVIKNEYGQNDENEFAGSDGVSSDEEQERQEEKENAEKMFRTIAEDGANFIVSEQFSKLFKAMGSTYDEEEHASTVERLSKEGKIYEDVFVAWYVNWIFGNEDSERENEEQASLSLKIEPTEIKSKEEIAATFSKFMAREGSWKCAVCMILNDLDAIKCSACETPNPVAPKAVVPVTLPSAATAGSIGASGFSFPVSAENDPKSTLSVTPVAGSGSMNCAGFSFGGTSTTTALDGPNRTTSFGTGFHFDTAATSAAAAHANVLSDRADTSERVAESVKASKSLDIKKTSLHVYGQNDENEFASSDGDSSDEEQQRKEEEATARVTFRTLASNGADYIASELFPKLCKAMGSTFDNDEGASIVEYLSKDGNIYEEDFVSWYVNWIFGGGDSESEDEDEVPAALNAAPAKRKSKEEIAAVFSKYAATEGSWQCDVCMVRNVAEAMKCSACETLSPAAPKVVAPATAASTCTGPIGSSGFSFPGTTSSSFSFGVTLGAGSDAANKANSTGFSFGTASSSTSFSGSSGTPASCPGLSSLNSPKLVQDTSGTLSTSKTPVAVKAASASSYPPDTTSKPKPPAFGVTGGTSYPPDTTSKPKLAVFGAASGNSYPPDTTSKPKPPAIGGATSGGYPPDTTSKPKPPAFGVTGGTSYPPDTTSKPKLAVFGAASGNSYPPDTTSKPKPPAIGGATSGGYPPDTTSKPKPPAFGPSTTSGPIASTSSNTLNTSGNNLFNSKPEPSRAIDLTARKSPFGAATHPNSAFSFGSTHASSSLAPEPSSTRPSFSFNTFSSTLDTTDQRNSADKPPPTKRTLNFGESTNTFEATTNTNAVAKTEGKPLTTLAKTTKDLPSSQMEGQLWKLIVDFDKSLQRVNQSATTMLSQEAKPLTNVVSQIDKLREHISSLCDQLNDLDEGRDRIEKNVFVVIGSNGDVHEQLEYGREILNSFNDASLKSTLDEQPLDARSNEAFESLKNKMKEVVMCCEELERHLLPFKTSGDRPRAVSSAHLFRVLKQTFDTSKAQYNKACQLAEQMERLSLRGDCMRQPKGFCGIHGGQRDAHALVTKTDMIERITESKERAQEVRCHFLTLCNNVITPRDVVSTQRRKPALPPPSNSPRRSKGCSTLMPTAQLRVASPMSTAKPSARSVSFHAAASKSTSKLVALAATMSPKDEPAKLIPTPQTSIMVGNASQRPSLDPAVTENKPTTMASLPASKPIAFSVATEDTRTHTAGNSMLKEEEPPGTLSLSSVGVTSPAVKHKRKADEKPTAAFSLGGQDPCASTFAFPRTAQKSSGARTSSYKTRLQDFYQVHNPSKLGTGLETTLTTYKGREEELFTQLFTTYVPTSTPEDVKTYLNGGPVPPKAVPLTGALQSPAPAVAKSPFQAFTASASTPTPASPFKPCPSTFSLGPAASTSFASNACHSAALGASTTLSSSFTKPAVDYRQQLVEFYQKHNPDKLCRVDATLQTYKGQEAKLFQNLALKYKVNSMSRGITVPPASPAVEPVTSKAAPSPFGNPSVFAPSPPAGMNAFGSTSSLGFGAAKLAPSASPFGSSPFLGTSQSSTGLNATTTMSGTSGFQSTTATASAFSIPASCSPASSGFGAANGLNYRDKLVAFYQHYNPAKLSSVDATLARYKGREEQLFAMLAQKYVQKTPTAGGLGLPSTTTAFAGTNSFGTPSVLGAAHSTPAFGSASTLGATATPAFGAGAGFGLAAHMGKSFGSAAPAASSGTVAGSGFGSFGSQPLSFGGAVQQSSGFGAGTSGGFGFGSSVAGGQPAAFSSSSFTQMR